MIPILLNFIEDVDDVTIAAFYQLLPKFVFNKVSQRIEETISKAKNWTNIHAAILMIYSIADEPLDETVGEFISNKFDLLIEASLPNQVPRLRETALFVIGLIIRNYPQIIAYVDSDKRINDIINSIEPTLRIEEAKQSNIG